MKQSKYLQEALNDAVQMAQGSRSEFVTPEHVLAALLNQDAFKHALFYEAGASEKDLFERVHRHLGNQEPVPAHVEYELTPSMQLHQSIQWAYQQATNSEAKEISVPHLVNAFLNLPDSLAHNLLEQSVHCTLPELMAYLVDSYELETEMDEVLDTEEQTEGEESPWRNFVTCLNEQVHTRPPLIGREAELERTIQVLCRREKNNPLHVGESGVGKTALVWGLAALVNQGRVPARLQGARIWELDLAGIVAGASYRGEFEKRLKSVLEVLSRQPGSIVYIDEVHNLVGAGQMEGSLDASQILRPYMMGGTLRFIGSTTYQELNRHLSRQRGLMRRFQQIDIPEPSAEETLRILDGLKHTYEKFHGVYYSLDVLQYVVRMSERHIADRFFPDKALDLLDEAGAWRETHPLKNQKRQTVGKDIIDLTLSRICKVNAEALREDSSEALATLGERLRRQIYGQDQAVESVVRAVEMAKAGLQDDDKPMASLLFVGPTGVGKTELCRVLARELGIELVRFDMSEYAEKHTVAKLIGSPAGYVGYEDGGLLTDAIRRTPNCVLLLDEIEKAHSDIYNILLQVMDYARLTDSRGQKADFRRVILVLTSNAGAQHAAQASVGFTGGQTAGQAMLRQVKRTFKPEFLNRLSGTVVFQDMTMDMASRILDKKLEQLQEKLAARRATLTLTPAARERILQRGFTRQYGAREMDRVIQQMLTPVLLHELLYGRLRKGGNLTLDVDDLRPG